MDDHYKERNRQRGKKLLEQQPMCQNCGKGFWPWAGPDGGDEQNDICRACWMSAELNQHNRGNKWNIRNW